MRSDGVLDVLTPETDAGLAGASDAGSKIGSSSSHTHIYNHAVREPCRIHHCMQHANAQPIRRSLIVALALTGATAFVAPQHAATGKALRAAAIEEEPEAPKYPTVNVIAAASDNSAI